MSRDHPALLPHDHFVFRCGPVRRSDDGAVAVTWDVVGTHKLTAWDAEVGRHGRRRDEGLRTIEGAQTRAAVHASIGNGPVSKSKIKTGLRLVVRVFMEDAVCKEGKRYSSETFEKRKITHHALNKNYVGIRNVILVN